MIFSWDTALQWSVLELSQGCYSDFEADRQVEVCNRARITQAIANAELRTSELERGCWHVACLPRMLGGFQTAFIRKRCGPRSARVHARPRRSKREGLDSRGKFFVGSTPQAIMRRGATWVLRGFRGFHADLCHAGLSRVPHGVLDVCRTKVGLAL